MHTLQNTSSEGQKPLISFIVPVYNIPADLLRECLESLLALPLHPDEREIIVVDDGSCQPPLTLPDDLERHVVCIRQANGGLSRARNTGIEQARGKYLQFVDSDDLLLTAAYSHCIGIVRKDHPDVVMFTLTSNMKAPASFHDTAPMSGTDYLQRENLRGSACGYLFRRACLGDLRFVGGIYHEDEEFTPQLLLRARSVVTTDAPAYYYRLRSESITTSSDANHIEKRLDDLKHIIFRLHALAMAADGAARQALQRRVDQLTMIYIYEALTDTHDVYHLCQQLKAFAEKGLYPLPDRRYNKKYRWFGKLSASKAGLRLLRLILPLMRKER